MASTQEQQQQPLRTAAVADYLARLHGQPAEIDQLTPLGEGGEEGGRDRDLKDYGYGQAIRIDYRLDGEAHRAVLQTVRPGSFGHQHMADRAAILLWSHRAYGALPKHVQSLDVGGFTADDRLVSLDGVEELFLLSEFVEGEEYAADIDRLRDLDEPGEVDLNRADRLCDYLVQIHREQGPDDPMLYRRQIRQLIGHSECIMGLADHYPADDPVAPPDRLRAIEQRCVAWRWSISPRAHRLRMVHGDFHPWNILFQSDGELRVLDRSRGSYGEPADDVTCLTANYLFEALRQTGGFDGPFATLYRRFWRRYLERSDDREMREVAAPFFAFRGLVLANPVWYPDLDPGLREQLLGLIEGVLASERFEPERLHELL